MFFEDSTRTKDISQETEYRRRETYSVSKSFTFLSINQNKETNANQAVSWWLTVGWLLLKTNLKINSNCMVAKFVGQIKVVHDFFIIKLYVICWNDLYLRHYLLCKCSFYVYALLSSIGKLLWGVFNRCLPQTVNYKIITTKSPWGMFFF